MCFFLMHRGCWFLICKQPQKSEAWNASERKLAAQAYQFLRNVSVIDDDDIYIPTKARPIQMNAETVEFCKKEINDLLEKKN